MSRRILIKADGVSAEAELNNSKTAELIADALPISQKANRWGEEIYFRIDVDADSEDPRDVMDAGDLAYWPPGKAFCIFWGPTPASQGDEIRAASPVNVVGKLAGDPAVFKNVRDRVEIRIVQI